MQSKQRCWFVPLVIGLLVIGFDQVSKYWVVKTLGPEPLIQAITLVGDWLHIIYSRNTGVAFGLFQGFPQFFTVTSLLICGGAMYVYWFRLPNSRLAFQLSMGLIMGGALGNVIDRIRLGYVVDFIQVGWFPVFNVADSAVTTGVILLTVYLWIVGDEQINAVPPYDNALVPQSLGRNAKSSSEE